MNIKLIAGAALIVATLAACDQAGPTYESNWRHATDPEISKTLVKANVRGCGEYKYKQRGNGSREFVVYCSRDGSSWTGYLVFPRIGEVMGPYEEGFETR